MTNSNPQEIPKSIGTDNYIGDMKRSEIIYFFSFPLLCDLKSNYVNSNYDIILLDQYITKWCYS